MQYAIQFSRFTYPVRRPGAQEGEGFGGYVFWEQAVGGDVQIAVLAGMGEAVVLFIEDALLPLGLAPAADCVQGGVEIYQRAGVGELPQVGHVRVLLGAGASVV